jgi:hypothetical protein
MPRKSPPNSTRPRKPRSGKRELQDALLGLAADALAILTARLGVGFQPGKIPPPMHECPKCHARFWMPVQSFGFCPACGARFEKGPGPGKLHMSKRQAQEFLYRHSGVRIGDFTARETVIGAYRKAAQKLHPDKGGSHDEFCKLQEAMEVLG